jgi:hypothetical protein
MQYRDGEGFFVCLERIGEELLYEVIELADHPRIPPRDIAAMIMEIVRGGPAPGMLIECMSMRVSIERAAVVARELLELDATGVTGLTFAAALAERTADKIKLLQKAVVRGAGREVELRLASAYLEVGNMKAARALISAHVG